VTLAKLALAALVLYAGAVAVLALAQGALVFPRAAVGAAPALPAQTARLELVHNGATLHGVRIAGRKAGLPLIMGFGGNAWNAESMALYLHQIAPDHDVVTYHYRGYAPSTGTPSAAALIVDATAIFDATPAPHGVIAVGFSIGSGIAAQLGAARPLRGLVLVTPFDNLRAVAEAGLPFFPVRWLFRHQIDTLSALRASIMPATLIIARRDEVIAPARSAALLDGLAQAGRAVTVVQIDAGHNDIYNRADAQAALRDAIRLR
jgi:pimeloyl-ACP methyl ester carboxylesterase